MRLVTPLAGVWIETCAPIGQALVNQVTPLAGVWIETLGARKITSPWSVTPLAGVWIETARADEDESGKLRHAPRGRVD